MDKKNLKKKTFKCEICSVTFEMNSFQPCTSWVDKDPLDSCVTCYKLAKIYDKIAEIYRMVLNG